MDMIRDRTNSVRNAVGKSLLKSLPKQDEYLNINKYKKLDSMIDPMLHRKALINAINEKYLNPVMQSLETAHLQKMHEAAEQ